MTFSFLFFLSYILVVASTPPVFDKIPVKNKTVKFQDAISLRCSSRPPVIYPSVWDWKKDGQSLSVEDIKSKRITSSAGTLVVRFAVAEDSGNYTCALVNSAGSVESGGTEVVVQGEFLPYTTLVVKNMVDFFCRQRYCKAPERE